MLGLNFSKSSSPHLDPKCIELLPCDWLISNLCYQAIEQVNLISGRRVCVYMYMYIYIYIKHNNFLFHIIIINITFKNILGYIIIIDIF